MCVFSLLVAPRPEIVCTSFAAHKGEPGPSVCSVLMATFVKWTKSHFNAVCYLLFENVSNRKVPPGLSFVQSWKLLPLKRGRCCGPWTFLKALTPMIPSASCLYEQDSSAEASTRVRSAPESPWHPPPTSPRQVFYRSPRQLSQVWRPSCVEQNMRPQTQVAEIRNLICLCLLHSVLVPGINMFTFAKSSHL